MNVNFRALALAPLAAVVLTGCFSTFEPIEIEESTPVFATQAAPTVSPSLDAEASVEEVASTETLPAAAPAAGSVTVSGTVHATISGLGDDAEHYLCWSSKLGDHGCASFTASDSFVELTHNIVLDDTIKFSVSSASAGGQTFQIGTVVLPGAQPGQPDRILEVQLNFTGAQVKTVEGADGPVEVAVPSFKYINYDH